MVQGVTEVFLGEVPSVGLVLKARRGIQRKREAYERRILKAFPDDAKCF